MRNIQCRIKVLYDSQIINFLSSPIFSPNTVLPHSNRLAIKTLKIYCFAVDFTGRRKKENNLCLHR